MNKLIALLLFMMPIQACAPAPEGDCGFIKNVYGQRVSWKTNLPVVLELHYEIPEQYIPVIESAIAKWENKAQRDLFKLIKGYRVFGPVNPVKDGSNIIYFVKDWVPFFQDRQAIAQLAWIGDEMYEGDLLVNYSGTYQFDLYEGGTGVSFESLIIHELGHILGLNHIENSQSVMYPYLANGQDRTAINEFDQANLNCEY